MSLSVENVHKEITGKKAELARKEKEAVAKKEEAARNTEAAWLAAEKAAKKEVKKGKKHVVEESGADAGAEGSKPKKRVKTVVVDKEDKNLLETTEVSCKR